MDADNELGLEKEAELLVYGYCRDYSITNDHVLPSEISYVVFLYIDPAGFFKINRFGFIDKRIYFYQQKHHMQQIKQENENIAKWMKLLFNNNTGVNSCSETQIANHWNTIASNKKLKGMIRDGIPGCFRPILWKHLCGAPRLKQMECNKYGSNTLYSDLKARNKPKYHDQIWKDINRTYRRHLQFGGTDLVQMIDSDKYFKLSLHDTRKAFSLHREDIGYWGAGTYISGFLLMHMTEEDVFWIMCCLAQDDRYKMANIWCPNMPDIQLRFYQMERCVSDLLPNLQKHFDACQISSASMYSAAQFFVTIFISTAIKMDLLERIWDIYLFEGFKTVFRFGVGYLKYWENELLNCDFEQMIDFFRTGWNRLDHDEYIKISLSLKITKNQLNRYKTQFQLQQPTVN
eukprot:630651_1